MIKLNIEKEIKQFDSLIKLLEPEKIKFIEKMMEVIGERFFTSPASYKIELHDAFPGGLLHHSLIVTKYLKDLCNLWASEINIKSIIVCGLFHDIGKIGTIDGFPLYTISQEQWKIERGQPYTYNRTPDGLTHAQRSVRILNHFNINLTDEEYIAILSHDGPYKEENKPFHYLKIKLPLLLHWSDMWSYINSKEK